MLFIFSRTQCSGSVTFLFGSGYCSFHQWPSRFCRQVFMLTSQNTINQFFLHFFAWRKIRIRTTKFTDPDAYLRGPLPGTKRSEDSGTRENYPNAIILFLCTDTCIPGTRPPIRILVTMLCLSVPIVFASNLEQEPLHFNVKITQLNISRGCSSVVERSLCMWKAPGSIPGISNSLLVCLSVPIVFASNSRTRIFTL